MSNQQSSEEFPSCAFEDAEDMLEFLHEKIENLAYFWALWSHTFLEGLDTEAKIKILVELIQTEAEYLLPKIIVRYEDDSTPGFKVLSGTIRRFQIPNTQDAQENQ